MSKKYKLTPELVKEIKKECMGGDKVHLTKLKGIASTYLSKKVIESLKTTNTKESREIILNHLCKAIDQLTKPEKKLDADPKNDNKPKQSILKHFMKEIPKENLPPQININILGKNPIQEKKHVNANKTMNLQKQIIDLPIVKHLSPESVPVHEIKIQVSKASAGYLQSLKREITKLDTQNYNIKSLEKDIMNDTFIKTALSCNIKALEYKVNLYQKLSKTDWDGHAKKKPAFGLFGGNQGISVNMNEIIKTTLADITFQLQKLKTNPDVFKLKRQELLNILYDPDNGIATVKGSSRESVRISLIKTIYMFMKVPEFFFKGFNNFMITGSAGSGKTKIAGVIAHTLKNLGVLATKKVVLATKQNLVGEFTGQSGPKTRSLLAGSMEGVIFIDEAYTLTSCPGEKRDPFSDESVGELINFIDKFIGCLVIIVAGYKNKMYDCFLTFNEGMARRFPKVVDLIPYDGNDMYNILETFLNDSINVNQLLSKSQRSYIKSILININNENIFNNQAGDMLNLSKIIGEDVMLLGSDYKTDMINLSFKKFCATKNIALDF